MSYDYDSFRDGQRWGDTGSVVAAAAARRDSNNALSEWMAYARKLENQLAQANLNLTRAEASNAANNGVVRELRQHILTIAPHDPLVQTGVVKGKIRRNFREIVERQGYRVVDMEDMVIARD